MKQPQRWRIANNSLHVLEQIYQMDRFPPQNTRNELANTLNVSARQIQVWFQNRRQRDRKLESKSQENAAKAASASMDLAQIGSAPLRPPAPKVPAGVAENERMERDESCETLLIDDAHVRELTRGGGGGGGSGLRPASCSPTASGATPAASALSTRGESSPDLLGLTPLTAEAPMCKDAGRLPSVPSMERLPPSLPAPAPPAPLSLQDTAPPPSRSMLRDWCPRGAQLADANVGGAWRSVCYSTLEQHCKAAVAAARSAMEQSQALDKQPPLSPRPAQPPAQQPPQPPRASSPTTHLVEPTPSCAQAPSTAVDLGGFPMLHLMLANGRAVRMPARLPMPLGMHATGTADMGGEPSLPAVVMTTNINYNHGDDSLDLERSIADELAAIDFGALPELGLLDCMGAMVDEGDGGVMQELLLEGGC